MGIVRTDSQHYADIANAIRSKNGSTNEYYPHEMAAAIEALEGGPTEDKVELYDITVTPTGETFTKYAEEGTGFSEVTVRGDVNLEPQNIASGVVIYGVEGTLVAGASIKVPDEYQYYVDHALTLYTDDYKHMAILESNTHLAIAFLMDDFRVISYDSATTEFTARNWLTCALVKTTNNWTITDWRGDTSTGDNYAKNIRYSSMIWEYNGDVIWPIGGSGGENLDAEMETQGELITQIFKAIEGKVGGSSGGGSCSWLSWAVSDCALSASSFDSSASNS